MVQQSGCYLVIDGDSSQEKIVCHEFYFGCAEFQRDQLASSRRIRLPYPLFIVSSLLNAAFKGDYAAVVDGHRVSETHMLMILFR